MKIQQLFRVKFLPLIIPTLIFLSCSQSSEDPVPADTKEIDKEEGTVNTDIKNTFDSNVIPKTTFTFTEIQSNALKITYVADESAFKEVNLKDYKIEISKTNTFETKEELFDNNSFKHQEGKDIDNIRLTKEAALYFSKIIPKSKYYVRLEITIKNTVNNWEKTFLT